MKQMGIQKVAAFFKRALPQSAFFLIRRIGTAVLTPLQFSFKTGHFKSSLRACAVTQYGKPLPWYSYPCIDFLKHRNFKDKTVLEFGAGQSTLWWAERSARVVSFEANEAHQDWYQRLKNKIPANVQLFLVSSKEAKSCVDSVMTELKKGETKFFDVIIIDGLFRYEMIDIAIEHLSDSGAIIFDNSEGYFCYDGFKNKGFMRIDFYGYSPGVITPQSTSIFFKEKTFLLDEQWPISDIPFGE